MTRKKDNYRRNFKKNQQPNDNNQNKSDNKSDQNKQRRFVSTNVVKDDTNQKKQNQNYKQKQKQNTRDFTNKDKNQGELRKEGRNKRRFKNLKKDQNSKNNRQNSKNSPENRRKRERLKRIANIYRLSRPETQTCIVCNTEIKSMASALLNNDKETCTCFDCALKNIRLSHDITGGKKAVYLGSGNFAIIKDKRIKGKFSFEIIERIVFGQKSQPTID